MENVKITFTNFLCLLCIVIFVLNITNIIPIDSLYLDSQSISNLQIHRLLTYSITHGGILHLIFNLVALYSFGPLFERLVSFKQYLLSFVIVNILCGFIFIFNYDEPLVGISGYLFFIIGYLTVYFPRLPVVLFFVELPICAVSLIFAVLSFILYSYDILPFIAHLIHLLGLVLGVISTHILRPNSQFNEIQTYFEKIEIETLIKNSNFNLKPKNIIYICIGFTLSLFCFSFTFFEPSNSNSYILIFSISSCFFLGLGFSNMPDVKTGKVYSFLLLLFYTIWTTYPFVIYLYIFLFLIVLIQTGFILRLFRKDNSNILYYKKHSYRFNYLVQKYYHFLNEKYNINIY